MPLYKDHLVGLRAIQHSQELETVTVAALQASLPDHILTVHVYPACLVFSIKIYTAAHVKTIQYQHNQAGQEENQKWNSQVRFSLDYY